MGTIAEQWVQEGMQQGEQQGILRGIASGLRLRFGPQGVQLMPEISSIHDIELLSRILDCVFTAASVDNVRAVYSKSVN